MEEESRVKKAQRRTGLLFLICLIIAFTFIGLPLFKAYSMEKEEAVNISEQELKDTEKEGRYVELEIDTLPISITHTPEKDSQFYFVTDVKDHKYIVNLSDKTIKHIVETLNNETGKLNSTYRIKGITTNIDEKIKKMALSNSYLMFKNNELTSDNFSEFFDVFYIQEDFVNDNVVTLYQCSALLGLFFLILAFGYVVPFMVKINHGKAVEKNIMQALEKHLPAGETLLAGVQGNGREVKIIQQFRNCRFDGEKIVPAENEKILQITKGKVASFELYLGITEHYMILSQCKRNKWYYESNVVQDLGQTDAEEVSSCISLDEIGTCFPLAEVQSCVVKKIWLGAIKCTITMKNGGFFKLQIPKLDWMPHHAKYREAILARLSSKTPF